MQKIKFKFWTSYFEQFGDRRIDPYLPQVAQFYINIAHQHPIWQAIFAYISLHVADTKRLHSVFKIKLFCNLTT